MSKRLAGVQSVGRHVLLLSLVASTAFVALQTAIPSAAVAGDAPPAAGPTQKWSSPFNSGWLVTLVQAATPPDRAVAPGTGPGQDNPITGPVLKPLPPIDPSEQADLLAAWRRTVQNAPAPTLTVTPAPTLTVTPAPVTPTAAVPSGGSSVQGVTPNEIRFGMSSPFSGAAKESGRNLMIGVETAFGQANDAGGIFGRQLKLVTADDGYEPARTTDVMKKLYADDKVFGYICNFGTATAAVAAPFALEHKMLFFGAFTGSTILRHDPPDRYVFNYRAAYAEETAAVLHYLVMVRRLRPDQIVVFAQEDGFGDAGYEGVQKELRRIYGGRATDAVRLSYKRNTVDVAAAVAQVMARRKTLKAVIMVATYRAAAKFIEKTRDDLPDLIYTNISGVGSTSLSDELVLLGPKYANGVIVTQIVPAVDSYATAILDYKTALAKYFPGEKPDYVSLEGFISANLLVNGLKRAGPQLDTEKLVDALETMHNIDMGLGTPLNFGLTEHQASHKIWATVLDGTGHYKPLDLE